ARDEQHAPPPAPPPPALLSRRLRRPRHAVAHVPAAPSLALRPDPRQGLGSLSTYERHPTSHVDREAVRGREDVAIDHPVLGTEETDHELLAQVIEQGGLAGREAAVDAYHAPDETHGRDRSAQDVEEAALSGPQVRRPEAERDAVDGGGAEEG